MYIKTLSMLVGKKCALYFGLRVALGHNYQDPCHSVVHWDLTIGIFGGTISSFKIILDYHILNHLFITPNSNRDLGNRIEPAKLDIEPCLWMLWQ